MSKLNLTLACWNYDRTRAIQDGSVQPDGIDINYHDLPVEETFFRMLRHQEFDVAEMSLSSYTVSLFREPRRFVRARVCRHLPQLDAVQSWSTHGPYHSSRSRSSPPPHTAAQRSPRLAAPD